MKRTVSRWLFGSIWYTFVFVWEASIIQRFSKKSILIRLVWIILMKCYLVLMHLRQYFLYSEDLNKNPVQLFVLIHPNAFHIPVSLHTKEKIYWVKETKVNLKNMVVGCRKNSKLKNSFKSSLIIFFNYIKPMIKNCCKIFWNI